MTRKFSLFLALVMLFSSLTVPAHAQEQTPVMPRYTNISSVRAPMTISDSGLAVIEVCCLANSDVTSIKVVTYIERYIGGLWARINITPTSSEWSSWTNSSTFATTRKLQLTSTGYYRAVSVFTVTAATAETVTRYSYATY